MCRKYETSSPIIKVHPIVCYEGTDAVQVYSSALSLTSALDGGVGVDNSTPRGITGYYCVGGLVSPSAGLDVCGKFVPTGIRSPYTPASSESGPSNPNIRAINTVFWTASQNWKPLIECDLFFFFLPSVVKTWICWVNLLGCCNHLCWRQCPALG